MKRHVFIINPVAGKGKGPELKSVIEQLYNTPIILLTRFQDHARELAEEYASADTVIYSVGGDGTLNEVINGVMRSPYWEQVIVAHVPCGSGNDFIKGMTEIKDPVALLEKYKSGKYKAIDVGVVNERYFINIASVGFDAEIVLGAKKFKRIPFLNAELAYILSVFSTLVHLKDYAFWVSIDEQSEEMVNVLFLTMANGNYYGGGMKAAPKAKLDDGHLDFCFIDQVKRREVPFLLPKFIKGKHEKLKVVHHLKGKTMEIRSKKLLPLNMDGEVVMTKHVQVRIKEKCLNVLLP